MDFVFNCLPFYEHFKYKPILNIEIVWNLVQKCEINRRHRWKRKAMREANRKHSRPSNEKSPTGCISTCRRWQVRDLCPILVVAIDEWCTFQCVYCMWGYQMFFFISNVLVLSAPQGLEGWLVQVPVFFFFYLGLQNFLAVPLRHYSWLPMMHITIWEHL